MGSKLNLIEDLYMKFIKAQVNFKKSPKDRITEIYLKVRLENLEKLWNQFKETHADILEEINSEELNSSNFMQRDTYDLTEEIYIEYKTELLSSLEKFQNVIKFEKMEENKESKHGTPQIKLPKLTIPFFSGNYLEWISFRDLFISLIHNNSDLDNVQKMHYLKSYVTGEAESLLRQIPISQANYLRCWSLLENRYNNRKYLSHCILKRLLGQKTITSESASALKELMDTTGDCLSSLKNLNIDVTSWDIIIIHIISIKLDADSRRQWELKVSGASSDQLPTLTQFYDFLTARYRALEFLEPKQCNNKNYAGNINTSRPKVMHATKAQCKFCSEEHKLNFCQKFLEKDLDTRRKFIQDSGICFNCLGSNHSAKFCLSTSTCRFCNRRHHSSLHSNNNPESAVNKGVTKLLTEATTSSNKELTHIGQTDVEENTEEKSTEDVITCFSSGNTSKSVLLATALVKAEARDGSFHIIRTLLDQGSQASFVTETTVQDLGLRKRAVKGSVTGIGGHNSLVYNSMVTIKLQSRFDSKIEIVVNAYVLKSITSILPAKRVNVVKFLDKNVEQLADPQYFIPSKINMLLGADIFSQIIQDGVKIHGTPVAQCTSFGWIISGVVGTSNDNVSSFISMHINTDTENILKQFWEVEAEPSVKRRLLTEEEEQCEQFFTATTQRDSDGRYVVRLPFRSDDPECKRGQSRIVSERRFRLLERKLNRNKDLKDKYSAVINEYIELNHMELVDDKDDKKNEAVYLPHHAVIKEDRDTTKIRVVFDASCKGTNGKSLNDDLMIGPSLQPELRHILMRWRLHPICLVADVVKMYRQVKVADQDTNYQRILWRENNQSEIRDYKLLRVTFGTASAPYLAVKAMQQVAYDECEYIPANDDLNILQGTQGKKSKYELAARRILQDFYVDDLMTGCEDIETALKLYHQLNEVLAKGGFELQKWSTNSHELMMKLKQEERELVESLKIKENNIIKILGLTWNRCNDTFQYSVAIPSIESVSDTKRRIISDICRLYDPLGWLAPSVVIAKILIQKIWLSGIGWDEKAPNNILKEWNTYQMQLSQLKQITIPCWIGTSTRDQKIQLHGFCDASKVAYAAVIYIRTIDDKGKINVKLITAKTKVAPIKTISVPRLELCGAALLSKLLVEVCTVLNIQRSDIWAWTDSEVVLAWLNSHPSRWKTFIANRVSEILCTLDSSQWHHVQSKQNPADCASRGLLPSELVKETLWFKGPDFLYENEVIAVRPKNIDTNLEQANDNGARAHCAINKEKPLEKYSSLNTLIRVVAYCRRFLHLLKPKTERQSTSYLTSRELQLALETCIKVTQKEYFMEDLTSLSEGKEIKKGQLKSLNPFIDGRNILRIGGRLDQAELCYERIHPILIPKNSHLAKLLISNAHINTLHGGLRLMLSYLNTKYYIIGAKAMLKSFVRKCVVCIRHSTATKTQLMGQVPSVRVTPSKVFLHSGVDYAGPISLRSSKGRGHHSYKGYICLFVCMATKAVHIEVVSDLTSKGFLAAFKRFVARRGHCSDLWSDNGTNFQGASKELSFLFTSEKSTMISEIAESLANNKTTWHFIPPHAPNFGGLWEAAIKSCKYHLKRVIGNSTLTFEEMSTLLSQIEACLNSRPLSRVDSPETLTVLTPGHFLVGEPLITTPDNNYEMSSISSLRRWQLTQRMLQDFWKRWSNEYLNSFFHRYKWNIQIPEPCVGDIVLVKEDDLPPRRWVFGRVLQKHPGPDGLTRVVTIQLKNSTIKRPTSKLSILPIT